MKYTDIVMKTILIFLFSICATCNDAKVEPVNNPSIALYNEKGAWDKSVTALKNMFEWMDLSVTMIDAEYVNNNPLDGFKIICFPGGDMYRYSQNLSGEGLNKIRKYVENGGNYIGVCGGAYFSSKKIIWQGNQLPMNTLELFDGTAEGTIDEIVPYPQMDMSKIEITDTLHPIMKDLPKIQWMLYYWGPVFKTENPNMKVLGKYDAVDLPAVIAFEYGEGKVFITGTHPEMEEDSNRDGVVFSDTIINNVHYYGEEQLDDQGSDWIMMKNAVDWLLDK